LKLVTRILSFEWLAVCLIASICALSIKLLIESGDRLETLTKEHTSRMGHMHGLKQAFQMHAIIEGRTRLQESRPQELIQARKQVNRVLKEMSAAKFPEEIRGQLGQIQDRGKAYLAKTGTLENVLKSIADATGILHTRGRQSLKAAQEPAEAGVTLLSIVGAIAILLSLILAARASKTIGQPLETLQRTVLDLTQPENAHRRVPDGHYDPNLRELGKAINQLAERLEQAENAPQRTDGLMRASAQQLIEGLKDPWIIADLSGRTRLSNQEARALLREYSPDELGLPEMVRSALEDAEGNKSLPVHVLKSSSDTSIGFAIRLVPPKTV
jgi:hypothetical protein